MTEFKLEELESDDGKGFNSKAHVLIYYPGHVQILFSYCEPILRYDAYDGTYHRLWDGWSATTGRHISAFSGLHKAEYMALPYEG